MVGCSGSNPAILAIQEVETGKITVQGQPEQKSS
jgi:DNA-directed RNA polymerase subunit K/omega